MHSMLFPFFVLFPLMKAVTTPAIDKLLPVNATVSFGRFSAVPVEGNSSQTATMIDGHGLQIEEGEKRSVDAAERKHFKGLAIFPDDPGIWPGGIVPYQLLSNFNSTEKAVISYGINEFHKKTCITFRPRKYDDMYFLGISGIPRKWCYSHVGRDTEFRTKDGKFMTELNMDPACFDGPAIIHELMHSIGFHHEHHREDRDPRIDETPRDPDPQADFQNRGTYSRSEAYYMGEYDTESVMHYDFEHFKPYIRTYFTQADIDNINTLYKCDSSMNRNPITEKNFAKKAMSKKRGRKNISLDATQKNSAKNNVNAMPRKSPGVQVSKTGKNAFNTNNPTKWNGAPTNAPRMIWSPTKGYLAENNAIRRSTALVRNNMNVKNNLKGNFMRTGNTPWTKATRNPRNVAKTNFITWRPTSPNRGYFADNKVVTNNAASEKHYTTNRYTLGRIAMGTNAPSRTSVEKNPKNTAGKSPVSRGSNKLYGRYLAGNSAAGRYTPSRRNNMNNRINRYLENIASTNNGAYGKYYTTNRYTLGRNAMGTNAFPRTYLEKNSRNAAGKSPVSRGSNKLYGRYLAGNRAAVRYTPSTRNNTNNRLYKYFAGNNDVTKNTAFGKYYNTTNRYTLGRNVMGMNAPSRTHTERDSRNAAGKKPVNWRSNILYGRYFGENRAIRRTTPSTRNNVNNKINPTITTKGWNRATLSNFKMNLRDSARYNPAGWSSNFNGRYFAGSNATKNTKPLGRNNMNSRNAYARYVMGKTAAWTKPNRYPKNAAGRDPVMRSSNYLHKSHLPGNKVIRRDTPPLGYNMNARSITRRNSADTDRGPWNGANRNPKAAGRNPVMQSSNDLYRSHLPRNKLLRRDTPPSRNNMNARSTTRRNSAGTDRGPWNGANRNPKAAGRNPVMQSSNYLYRSHLPRNKVLRRDTPPSRNNMNARSTTRRNSAGTDRGPWNGANRNPKAARRNPFRRISNNLYRNYFAGNNTTRNSRPFRKNNMNERNNQERNDTMNNRNTGRRNRTFRNAARSRFTGSRRNVRENMK